jgi:hypothetical protein
VAACGRSTPAAQRACVRACLRRAALVPGAYRFALARCAHFQLRRGAIFRTLPTWAEGEPRRAPRPSLSPLRSMSCPPAGDRRCSRAPHSKASIRAAGHVIQFQAVPRLVSASRLDSQHLLPPLSPHAPLGQQPQQGRILGAAAPHLGARRPSSGLCRTPVRTSTLPAGVRRLAAPRLASSTPLLLLGSSRCSRATADLPGIALASTRPRSRTPAGSSRGGRRARLFAASFAPPAHALSSQAQKASDSRGRVSNPMRRPTVTVHRYAAPTARHCGSRTLRQQTSCAPACPATSPVTQQTLGSAALVPRVCRVLRIARLLHELA